MSQSRAQSLSLTHTRRQPWRRSKATSSHRAGCGLLVSSIAVLALWHSSHNAAQTPVSPLPPQQPLAIAKSPRLRPVAMILPKILTEAGLASRAMAASNWCQQQGTATLAEILENLDSFAADIGLEQTERRRLEEALSSLDDATYPSFPSDAAVLDSLPADALVESPSMRKLSDYLNRVLQIKPICRAGECSLEDGRTRLDAFLTEATSQLRGTQGADWTRLVDSLLGPSAGDAERKEAMGVLEPAVNLFTLGNDQADELVVTEAMVANGQLSFGAIIDGKEERLRLQKTQGPSPWGLWSSYYVSVGPASLLGKRFVASKPNVFGRNLVQRLKEQTSTDMNGESPKAVAAKAGDGRFSLVTGDVVYFAGADRAAVLELANYDRMPEMAQQLADVLKEREKAGRGGPEVLAPEDLKEAARFRNREELLGPKERLAAKFQRLTQFPILEDALKQARGIPEVMALEGLAGDWAMDLYNATRTNMLRTKKPSAIAPRKVEVNRMSVPKALGLVALFVSVVFAASQMHIFEVHEQQFSEDLPLFTLQGA